MYLVAALFLTLLNLMGIPEELFLFEPTLTFKKMQIWRPFTSAIFLGKADMSMASNLYFLVKFGQEMERADGAAQQLTFILFETLILTLIGTLIGFPSFSRSVIAATIYCCSRRKPMDQMEVQFGVKIQFWLLPYVNALVDMLQAQSPAALMPHIVGIFAGHIYYFFAHVVPDMGGKRYIIPPKAFTQSTTKTQKPKARAAKKRPSSEKATKTKVKAAPVKKEKSAPRKPVKTTKSKSSKSAPSKKKRSKSGK